MSAAYSLAFTPDGSQVRAWLGARKKEGTVLLHNVTCLFRFTPDRSQVRAWLGYKSNKKRLVCNILFVFMKQWLPATSPFFGIP